MPTALEGARRSTPPAELVSTHDSEALLGHITAWLDDAKAEKVVAIDIRGKSSIGDYMVIASGRSDRHVGAIAEQLQRKLREAGHGRVRIEGEVITEEDRDAVEQVVRIIDGVRTIDNDLRVQPPPLTGM